MFVQIGQRAVSVERWVCDIELGDDEVGLYFPFTDDTGDQVVVRFSGPEYYAFMEWWEKKANVYVCYVEGE